MRFDIRRFRTLLLALALWAVSARAADQEEPLLGRAGEAPITERAFRERFELTPGLNRHRGARLETDKQEVLYSMIAEKLLAQEALARRLDADSLYQRALSEVTKLLARDALYRREFPTRLSSLTRICSKAFAAHGKSCGSSFSSSRIPRTRHSYDPALPPHPTSTGCPWTLRSAPTGTRPRSSGVMRTRRSKTRRTPLPGVQSRSHWLRDRDTTS